MTISAFSPPSFSGLNAVSKVTDNLNHTKETPMADDTRDEMTPLLARWAAGDDDALAEFYPAYFAKVVTVLKEDGHRIDDAGDAAQEAFARLNQRVRDGHPLPKSLTAYLLTLARERATKKDRRKPLPMANKGRDGKNIIDVVADNRGIATQVGSLEIRNLLRESIERLPERCRKVYKLRLDGLKEREIAEKLGLSTGTVKGYVSEGLDILKKDLDDVARQMTTWYHQRAEEELTPVDVLRALEKIAWLYADPVRLKHFENLSDDDGAAKLSIAPATYQARLKQGYALLEQELGAEFPRMFEIMSARETE